MSDKPVRGVPAAGGMWTERNRAQAERLLARLSESERGPSPSTWEEKAEWARAAAESLAIRVGGGSLEPLPLARLRSAAQFSAWKEFFLERAERLVADGNEAGAAKMVALASKADDTARLSEVAAHQLAARQAETRGRVDPLDALMGPTATEAAGIEVVVDSESPTDPTDALMVAAEESE